MNFQKSKSTMKELMQFMDPILLLMLLSNQFPKELNLDIGVSEEKLKSLDFCWAFQNKISKMLSIHHPKNGSKKINFIWVLTSPTYPIWSMDHSSSLKLQPSKDTLSINGVTKNYLAKILMMKPRSTLSSQSSKKLVVQPLDYSSIKTTKLPNLKSLRSMLLNLKSSTSLLEKRISLWDIWLWLISSLLSTLTISKLCSLKNTKLILS